MINKSLHEHIRKPSPYLRRRLDMLDYEVEKNLYGQPFGGSNICIFFKSDIEYFESIMENSIDAMYYNYFSHIDDNSGEWAHEYLDMVNYIRNKYQDKIMKHYDDNCGSGSIPLKESIKKVLKEELNESTYLRRRVDMSSLDEEFYENLDIVTNRFLKLSSKKQYYSFNDFKNGILGYIIEDFHYELTNNRFDDYPYDEVYEFLSNHYHDKIKDRYVEVFGGNINESENIRKVLKEELNESTYLRRRVDMSSLDKKFFTNLNIVTDKYLKRHDGYCSFNVFRTTVISYLIDDYRDNLSDEDYDNFPYDEVYNFLFNLFYDKIKDRYVEVFGGDIDESENIRKVLKEETNYTRMLLRRLPTDILNNIDNLFNSSLNYISKIFIKSYNSDPNKLSEREFIRRVIEDFLSITGARHYLPDQESDEYTEWIKTLTNELTNKYKDKIKSMYRVLKK